MDASKSDFLFTLYFELYISYADTKPIKPLHKSNAKQYRITNVTCFQCVAQELLYTYTRIIYFQLLYIHL